MVFGLREALLLFVVKKCRGGINNGIFLLFTMSLDYEIIYQRDSGFSIKARFYFDSSSLLGFLFLILELKFGIEKYIDGVKNSVSRS